MKEKFTKLINEIQSEGNKLIDSNLNFGLSEYDIAYLILYTLALEDQINKIELPVTPKVENEVRGDNVVDMFKRKE